MPPVTKKQQNHNRYWRSLDELENTPEFQELLHREFPQAASEFPQGVSRRRWLQLMSASLALGGVTGCRYEQEKIAPFAARPHNRVPGEPQQYATSIEYAGSSRHLLVTCYDGRPSRSKEKTGTRPAKGLRTPLRRRRFWICTIPIAVQTFGNGQAAKS